MIPNAIQQYVRASDPTVRETYGFIEDLKARLPGYSKDLFPKRDMWGEPIRRDPGALGDGTAARLLSPGTATGPSRDYLTQEVMRLDLTFDRPDKALNGVELTGAQYDEYSAFRGQMLREVMGSLVESPVYQALPDMARREMLRRAFSRVNDGARKYMLVVFPELATMRMEEKARALQEGRRPEKVERSGGFLGLGGGQ